MEVSNVLIWLNIPCIAFLFMLVLKYMEAQSKKDEKTDIREKAYIDTINKSEEREKNYVETIKDNQEIIKNNQDMIKRSEEREKIYQKMINDLSDDIKETRDVTIKKIDELTSIVRYSKEEKKPFN